MAAAAGPLPNVPDLKARYARINEPTKFPRYEAVQFFVKAFVVVFPSIRAAVTRAVLPVKSSPPVTRVMISPNGSPNAPKIILQKKRK
jgi:hypothetical protein